MNVSSPHCQQNPPRLDVAIVLRWLLFALAAYYLVVYVVLASLRLPYRYELMWMEGAMVDHVARLLHGQALYVRPTIDFVPYIYPPLYYYVSAGVAQLTGVGFLPLRIVSVLASLGGFALLYLLVARETRSRASGLLAAGLYAATYAAVSAWFDIGRIDSLFVFFVLLGIYWLRGTSRRALVGAALAFTLAVLTKQSAVLIAVFAAVALFSLDRRRALAFAGFTAVLCGAAVLAQRQTWGDWYWYFVWMLPSQHKLQELAIIGFWQEDILYYLAPAVVLALCYFFRPQPAEAKSSTRFFAIVTAGMIISSWMSRLHTGGYVNVLMPAFAAYAILFGLAYRHVPEMIPHLPADKQSGIRLGLLSLFVLQLLLLLYNPLLLAPTREKSALGDRIMRWVAQQPGDVYLPWHGYVATYAGKRSHAHFMAIMDILRADDSPQKSIMCQELFTALGAHRFPTVLDDGFVDFRIATQWRRTLLSFYTLDDYLPDTQGQCWTLTDIDTCPRQIFHPRKHNRTPPTFPK